jgi:hypothetical protein
VRKSHDLLMFETNICAHVRMRMGFEESSWFEQSWRGLMELLQHSRLTQLARPKPDRLRTDIPT